MRTRAQKYPDYTAEIEAIRETGVTPELLSRIIQKHQPNALYNQKLLDRYEALESGVPIFQRRPRFEDAEDTINNTVNNDFFGEIVDFKVGYFAGNPVAYSYSNTEESRETTGSAEASEAAAQKARDKASKALTDFVTRNNMYDIDMEATKFAAICGYAGRMFYIDPEGNERCMVVSPTETIILSETGDITEPTYGVRYYTTTNLNDREITKVEFHGPDQILYYEGQMDSLKLAEEKENLFGMCTLQGIPNNREMTGDGEKVLELIDAYDRALSDESNEIDSFANAYMVYENVMISDEEIAKSQKSGAIQFQTTNGGKVYFLTKDVNDSFQEHHLDRIERNIYRFSKTPNLSDDSFATASGIALKFKLTGLETKCGMFEAKFTSAGAYMFRVLSSALGKKGVTIDPLQCVMECSRNFPLDILSEAQAAQQLISAGLPKRVAYQIALSCIDDVEWVMEEIEAEKEDIPSLTAQEPEDGEMTGDAPDPAEAESAAEEAVGKPLNGSQTHSLLSIVRQVQTGTLTEDQAASLLATSIGVTKEEAKAILRGK